MAEKYIKLEDAVAVLCLETCTPGAFCPDNYCVEMWNKFKRLYNREIETFEIPRWIPSSERLPEDQQRVLITGDKGGITIARFDGKYFWMPYWIKGGSVMETVAWMPLPKPYKDGEQDG